MVHSVQSWPSPLCGREPPCVEVHPALWHRPVHGSSSGGAYCTALPSTARSVWRIACPPAAAHRPTAGLQVHLGPYPVKWPHGTIAATMREYARNYKVRSPCAHDCATCLAVDLCASCLTVAICVQQSGSVCGDNEGRAAVERMIAMIDRTQDGQTWCTACMLLCVPHACLVHPVPHACLVHPLPDWLSCPQHA